jgi:hypothetical protein
VWLSTRQPGRPAAPADGYHIVNEGCG